MFGVDVPAFDISYFASTWADKTIDTNIYSNCSNAYCLFDIKFTKAIAQKGGLKENIKLDDVTNHDIKLHGRSQMLFFQAFWSSENRPQTVTRRSRHFRGTSTQQPQNKEIV